MASLQETELENDKGLGIHRGTKEKFKAAGQFDRHKSGSRTEEPKKTDDKLEARKAYRKAKRLCFTCGEKWNHTHKCPAHIPLHIMEELLEVLHSDYEDTESSRHSSSSSDDDLMLLEAVDTSSHQRQRRTIRLHGLVEKQHIAIFVDSGANASFISEELAKTLTKQPVDAEPARFVAANGAPLTSSNMIPELHWYCQGHSFTQDFQVLPLPCYDMIMGADWLAENSPMLVHWKKKWMTFTHQGTRIKLLGVQE